MTIIQNLIFTMQVIHFGNSRLGHFNIYNNIKEFIIKHTSFHNKKECPERKISKLRRKPFSASDSFTTEPLQLVHTDVVGKLET